MATNVDENLLTEQKNISDYGPFTDPTIPSKQENMVFVNEEYGSIAESVLITVVRKLMKEELSTMLMDMGAFQEKNGSLYYGSKKLVYASDIFLT